MASPIYDCILVTNSIDGGGAEISMGALHGALNRRIRRSMIIALNESSEKSQEIQPNVRILGRPWKTGVAGTLANLRDFQRELRNSPANFLIINCELPELYAALTPLRGKSLIVVEHTTLPWFHRRSLGVIVRFVLKMKKAQWVTVNTSSAPIWHGAKTPVHIPNPVEASPHLSEGEFNEPTIVAIGRLRGEKRVDWIIEALEGTQVPIKVYGDGAELKALENLATSKGVNVEFCGYKKNVWSELPQNSVVVIPSAFEGDGRVVAEAIINNYPVLLADNQDLRRFKLENQNYFKDPAELKTRIADGLLYGFLRYRPTVVARKGLMESREIERVAEQWITLMGLDLKVS